MEIVRAQPNDAAALSAIARAAKAHWGYPAAWLEQWRDLLTITPQFITANETFIARDAGEIAGFHALLESSGELRLEHLWVIPGRMGDGIGRALYQHALGRARARGATCLTIESDPNAEPFYRRMGAVRRGVVTSQIEGQPRALPLLVHDLEGNAPSLPSF